MSEFDKNQPPPSYGFHAPDGSAYPTQGPPQEPPPYSTATVTVVTQPIGIIHGSHTVVATRLVPVGSESQRLNCPHCNADVSTKVTYSEGTMTHIVALVLCLVGCIPCCLIPYCVDSCKNAEHTCPNCQRHVGFFRRM